MVAPLMLQNDKQGSGAQANDALDASGGGTRRQIEGELHPWAP